MLHSMTRAVCRSEAPLAAEETVEQLGCAHVVDVRVYRRPNPFVAMACLNRSSPVSCRRPQLSFVKPKPSALIFPSPRPPICPRPPFLLSPNEKPCAQPTTPQRLHRSSNSCWGRRRGGGGLPSCCSRGRPWAGPRPAATAQSRPSRPWARAHTPLALRPGRLPAAPRSYRRRPSQPAPSLRKFAPGGPREQRPRPETSSR